MTTPEKTTATCLSTTILLCCLSIFSHAQTSNNCTSGKILQGLKKLNVLSSVLYIAAHPDDENNTLIAYLANEKLANVGYLSLTRGDGGQNLIGPEIREELGILRTQELLAARRVDGGNQYFATANDFGFSKNPEETFSIWNKEKLLADMVWMIRKTRPDVLITRYSRLPADTHGHHTASAILAYEAFDAAADPKRFPEQLKYVRPWQATRLLWNTGPGFYIPGDTTDKKKLIQVNVGQYNVLLGKSYGEIAAESRSMHKCQGMGIKPQRGNELELFRQVKGVESSSGIFEGIDTSWNRIPKTEKIAQLITKAIDTYNPQKPALLIPDLIAALSEIDKLPDSYWKEVKTNAIKTIIAELAGLVLDATTNEDSVTPGKMAKIKIEVINRSDAEIRLKNIWLPYAGKDTALNLALKNNLPNYLNFETTLDPGTPYSQPYWLKEKASLGLFQVKDQQNIGLAENKPEVSAIFNLLIAGYPVSYTIPLSYKYTDPKAGEVYQPLQITPPVFVALSKDVYVFSDNGPQTIYVKIKSGTAHIQGKVKLNIPAQWHVEPQDLPFNLQKKGDEQLLAFTLSPPPGAGQFTLQASACLDDGKSYHNELKIIRYPHVPVQAYFPEAIAKVVKIALKKTGNKIAYIPGAGDRVPESLQQAGYELTLLKDQEITTANLARYDAVVIGIRAYNVNERLNFHKDELLNYVKNGGNLIVQYNTDFDLPNYDIGPYPFHISGKRVTDEHAPVTLLNKTHPLLNRPNQISPQDFEGWVQERGAYFADNWDQRYQPLVSFNDPAEPPLHGGILVADYGKGHYIYTSLAWFRQLPAGVPGAYRLFANLLGLGK
ncbi:PIG-L family deacetylase [Pedobacter sp. MC2016-24]|uniref:PIG-L family deacetylase n=1 Tax=Pedobacter sp. MC2016-24 TaxID=2780090 RepID=UPI0018819CE8|nr:PIG-L family deacetylase [Pedobacter sp. MC2016-24]MBE9601754.1 PIG-L family deacetylase [Pedobacter sp. MC2016-24]